MASRLNVLGLGIVLLAGCSATPANLSVPNSPASAEGAEAQLAACPVIVRLVGRRETLTVNAGPSGQPLVSIQDEQGRYLARGLTMDQLRDREPDTYRRLVPGVASSRDGVVMDAGLGTAE